jgi:hypothetical protein
MPVTAAEMPSAPSPHHSESATMAESEKANHTVSWIRHPLNCSKKSFFIKKKYIKFSVRRFWKKCRRFIGTDDRFSGRAIWRFCDKSALISDILSRKMFGRRFFPIGTAFAFHSA